ncbi:MAG: hypothetical protein ACLFTR_00960 [Candidatus Woesearchaeota archaeon]
MMRTKKADAIWLSWVLLLAFVVALSVFMFAWSEERGEMFAGELRVMADTAECNSVRIRIEDICQNPQSLEFNITNRESITVNQLSMNIYDVYVESPISRDYDVDIRPADTRNVRVLKQSTTYQLEIVPVIITEDDMIYCYEKSLTETGIDYCQ